MFVGIGENIQKFRKRRGLTQKELAEKLGIATGTLQQYELDKREPRLAQLGKIAEVLGVSIHSLMDLDWDSLEFVDCMMNNAETLEEDLIANFNDLNLTGKKKALDYVCDLKEIKQYTDSEIEP